MLSHISNDIIKLVKNREKNWTKTNIRKQCYGREIKEEKEMIKEDKRRQPQNQALCVHSYESKYKLDSNSKFRKSRPKANEKHLFHDFEYCKRHSKYKASTTTPHVSISRWTTELWHLVHNLNLFLSTSTAAQLRWQDGIYCSTNCSPFHAFPPSSSRPNNHSVWGCMNGYNQNRDVFLWGHFNRYTAQTVQLLRKVVNGVQSFPRQSGPGKMGPRAWNV